MHDVDLVDGRESAALRARELEGDPGDSLDLRAGVLAGVEPGPVLTLALGAEVETADELTHDEHVDALGARRPEVRVDVQLLAKPQQPLLRPHRLPLELGQPDRCEQHSVGLATGGERLLRERGSLCEDRVATEGVRAVRDPERVEHAGRLRSDLGTDPVARENRNRHALILA